MTDTQLYLAIGIPGALFALNFLAILAAAFWQSKRFEDMGARLDSRIDSLEKRLDSRIDSLEKRLDSRIDSLEKVMYAEFKAQTLGLLRVEEVIDARLKHLEENKR